MSPSKIIAAIVLISNIFFLLAFLSPSLTVCASTALPYMGNGVVHQTQQGPLCGFEQQIIYILIGCATVSFFCSSLLSYITLRKK